MQLSDIEQGLKEAVEAARGSVAEGDKLDIVRGARSPSQPGKYGRPLPNFNGAEPDRVPPLTAPQVIETIMTLTKQAHSIDALSYELSDDLAGAANNEPQVNLASGGNEASMSVFDRMGLGLLELTRALESIDRNVRRSLGAVRP